MYWVGPKADSDLESVTVNSNGLYNVESRCASCETEGRCARLGLAACSPVETSVGLESRHREPMFDPRDCKMYLRIDCTPQLKNCGTKTL